MARVRVELAKDLRAAIASGHPWLFDRAIGKVKGQPRPGDVVDVSYKGEGVATGFIDPGSPLRVRILETRPGQSLRGDWVRRLAEECALVRSSDPALASVSCRRLMHGENDYAPGLVVDVYERTAVVMLDGPGATAFWRPRLDDVIAGLESAGVELERVWLRPRGGKAEAVRGDRPPNEVVVSEDAIRFAVDVVKGQKTGLFLDQRDNRRRVAALAPSATVLNLFSYNGGFSIAAALAGARMTTSVDIAAPAIASARRSFELSGVDPGDHELVALDVFEFAAQAQEQGRRFDVVVCDPPSFASSAKHRGRALAAYRRLAAACMDLVESGGVVVFASCSSHVDDRDLLGVLGPAARQAGRRLHVRAIHGAASDHPVRPEFPEGRYLNAIFAATGS
jgi:23S rRNA (cytosine1962-C5)-methyltransferase